jgi:hypothetical protein
MKRPIGIQLLVLAFLSGMLLTGCGEKKSTSSTSADSTALSEGATTSEESTTKSSNSQTKPLDGSDVMIDGDNSSCISVVPGQYTLTYTPTPTEDLTGKMCNKQIMTMKVKIKLNKTLAGAEFGDWPTISLMGSDGQELGGDFMLGLSMTELDRKKFEKFLAGTPGDEKEFHFSTESNVSGSTTVDETGKHIYDRAATFMIKNITNTAGQ